MEEKKVTGTQNMGSCSCERGKMPYGQMRGGRNSFGTPAGGRPQYAAPIQQRGRGCGTREEMRMGDHTHRVDGQKLRRIIDQASFAMDDTRLFLDTHPHCEEAFDYFKKMEKVRKEAIKEYEIHCGSILSYQADERHRGDWDWNTGPLPWENGCCNERRV